MPSIRIPLRLFFHLAAIASRVVWRDKCAKTRFPPSRLQRRRKVSGTSIICFPAPGYSGFLAIWALCGDTVATLFSPVEDVLSKLLYRSGAAMKVNSPISQPAAETGRCRPHLTQVQYPTPLLMAIPYYLSSFTTGNEAVI
ncbi:hypothetical protein QBC33DRAFT_184313 [Phialemonium atrogriseum]|uniref:Uncharacterized protein n=1 Tax=Phialemonium atrogriseum TaxID=1093897 RepID=A0AAJ0FL69_9PEZI|nr:uncharacterized protein QBC33DRAFT_184313 [Phialemonium atrogriseum]KAK1764805.1 hypothetical protein QBC33DRAFT_184313 [Phialemonium atrogriseum]